MNFLQRVSNTVNFYIERFFQHFVHFPRQRELYAKHFPNAKRSFDEVYQNFSLIFMNQHVTSASSRPMMPNMIEIGGIHVDEPKPLPHDMQQFLDSAEHGAIFFSMGSVIQAFKWPEEKREALVRVFSKLKQKVIWKYENETLPNKPDNVMISKWLPQSDILAHPNIKFFISHCGLLGTTEALHRGVPMLGFPVYADQMMNMAKTVARGSGVQVNFDDITEQAVSDAINELLSNPKYRENAQLISQRFKDRPMTPKQTVVFWTEYLARNKGAPYLSGRGKKLSFAELHLVDVHLFLIVMILSLICVTKATQKSFNVIIFNSGSERNGNNDKKNM